MKIGIIGAGSIARSMADTINGLDDFELYAIASRSLEKARDFARQFGVTTFYGSYEELVSDPQVELVYIATPHSHHFEHMKLCIDHNKPVLCEKAFTMTADETHRILEYAHEHKVFVAEAIWTRYMPSRRLIDELLAEQPVGKISMVTCNLSYDIDKVERVIRPELAGGALLDVGVYGLNFLTMHLGTDIERIDTSVVMTDTGVDGRESLTLVYRDGTMGVASHGIYGRSDRKGIFYGETGYIIVENINNPQSIDVYDSSDKLIRHIGVPAQVTGYEYEVIECARCIREGRLEPESMPHSDTVYIMEMMHDLRRKWGMTAD